MAYFHKKWAETTGGRAKHLRIKILGETLEELLSLRRAFPEAVTIVVPPRGHDSYRSKSLPHAKIPADRTDILEAVDSCPVDENYLKLISFILREDIYRHRVGHTPETEKWFQNEIRGKLILLLRMGSWVDEPENLGLKNLQQRLEKIDLGRRSDLKFSSRQSLTDLKYDQDIRMAKKAEEPEEEEEPFWLKEYRNAGTEQRMDLYKKLPGHQQYMVRERFGEP